MKTENGKEQWIDDVLGSTQGMSRAQAPANLYDRVMTDVRNWRSVRSGFSVRPWAAAAMLLVAVNIASVIYFSRRNGTAKAVETAIAGKMTLITTYSY